jgi:tight adherence protein C
VAAAAPFVFGAAALLFAVAGLSLIGYAVLAQRDGVSQRVDSLIAERASAAHASGRTPQYARPADGRSEAAPGEWELRQLILRLGLPAAWGTWASPALRILLGLLLATTLLLLSYGYKDIAFPARLAVSIGVGGGLGWLLTGLVLKLVARRHLAAVERGLPDAIELLVVSVEAGMGLEEGLDRLVPELAQSQPILAEELRTTAADLKLLPSREEAFTRLAERVGGQGVHSVAMTLSQTMRYGTPLADALRMVATELRNDTLLRLEARANRMPVLMTLPMLLFTMPALFLVIGGPAILRLLDVIGK